MNKPLPTLKEIRAIIQEKPCPCEIIPREEQSAGLDEEREFMSSIELWSDLKEQMKDE